MRMPLRLLDCMLSMVMLSSQAIGATITASDTHIMVSGMLDESDVAKVDTLLKQPIQYSEVVFDNCLGGQISAGYHLGQLIQQHGLNTLTRNQCQSSCTLAFMSGHSRHLSSEPGLHIILFHGARNIDPSNDVAATVTKAMITYLDILSGNRLTRPVKDMIAKSSREDQGFIVFTRNAQSSRTPGQAYCDGMHNGKLSCTPVKDADPVALGILTTP